MRGDRFPRRKREAHGGDPTGESVSCWVGSLSHLLPMRGLGQASHREPFKARRRTLPEPTEGEPHAGEREMGRTRFVAPAMTEMLQQPGAQWPLLFAHQSQEEGIGECRHHQQFATAFRLAHPRTLKAQFAFTETPRPLTIEASSRGKDDLPGLLLRAHLDAW